MKKITCMLLVGLLIFALCACSQNNQSAMYIKPSDFLEETQDVLSLFDDEIQFFDISFDETAKSYAVSNGSIVTANGSKTEQRLETLTI